MSFNLTVRKDGVRSAFNSNTISPLPGAVFRADGPTDFNLGPTDVAGNFTQSLPTASYIVTELTAPPGFNTISHMMLGPFANPVLTPYQETVNLNQNRQTRRFINWHDNNAYPDTCGLRIALILDRSASIDANEWAAVQNASVLFVNSLVGTGDAPPGTDFMLITFGTNAQIVQVAGQNWTSLYTQAGADAVNAVINGLPTPSSNEYTNWDAAFRLAANQMCQTVVMVTDGNPTARNVPAVTGTTVTMDNMEAAIASANLVKVSPLLPKIVGVGIGDGLSADNIKLITGPVEDDDYYLTNFDNLAIKLNQVAVKLCGALLCIHADTLVNTYTGIKPISELAPGDLVIDQTGQFVPLTALRKAGSTTRFVQIKAGSLGANVPTKDLLLTRGHPVLLRGQEVECQHLINGTSISEVQLAKSVDLYTLVTERRSFVQLQGVLVGSWSSDAFDNLIANDPRYARFE